jgi:uncharacterized membrane protein YjjB (DUF3815 family)
MVELLVQFALAMGATFGFAVLFNAPRRALLLCALNGGIAFVSRRLVLDQGASLELATLIAALGIGLVGELGARALRTPALIFKVTGFIPLVPGALSYRTVFEIINGNYADGLATGLRTGMLAAAIAGGIGTITALFRMRDTTQR